MNKLYKKYNWNMLQVRRYMLFFIGNEHFAMFLGNNFIENSLTVSSVNVYLEKEKLTRTEFFVPYACEIIDLRYDL